jgi:hypothetical protein
MRGSAPEWVIVYVLLAAVAWITSGVVAWVVV